MQTLMSANRTHAYTELVPMKSTASLVNAIMDGQGPYATVVSNTIKQFNTIEYLLCSSETGSCTRVRFATFIVIMLYKQTSCNFDIDWVT